MIREQDPLKQGLKPDTEITALISIISIREQDPLKQGLKPVMTKPDGSFTVHSRARSTKTRIETCF